MSPVIQEMIESAKAIVAFYNRSTKGTERLTELQEQLSLPKHKLLSDCPTRWNSIYYMLAQLLEQKPATTVMLTKLLYMRKSGKKLPKISEVNNQEISPVRHT